jgi:hypothetical protein
MCHPRSKLMPIRIGATHEFKWEFKWCHPRNSLCLMGGTVWIMGGTVWIGRKSIKWYHPRLLPNVLGFAGEIRGHIDQDSGRIGAKR